MLRCTIIALGQLMLEKDRLDGLEVILGGEIHHREELVIELAMLVGQVAVAAMRLWNSSRWAVTWRSKFMPMKPLS